MTIASQTSRIAYTGDGVTTAFSVPFFFSANADLVVYIRDTGGTSVLQALGTNYTLSGAGVSAGGTLTFVTAPTSAYSITIYRDPPLTQTASYNNNDPFPAKSHENALDKAVTIDQRTRDLGVRALHLDDADDTATMTLPTLEVRKGKLLAFDLTTGDAEASLSNVADVDSVVSAALSISRGLNSPQVVATIAALKAVSPFTGAVMFLEGSASVNDGGAGHFYWNASSVLADDGVMVIQPNAGGVGRWIRLGLNTPQVAATIAALKAVTPFTGALMYLEGSASINDGGAGHFYWDASSVLADDGVMVIQPNAGGTGRWIRLHATNTETTSITPQQYDILAGTAGHDSTAAIAAAIAACPTGGKVRIPATTGGYLISGGFAITKAITIEGDGMGTFFTGTLSGVTDLFSIIVPASSGIRGVHFKSFNIKVSGGRNWFYFDTTAASSYMAEVEISDVYTLESPTGPGRSCIYLKDSAGSQFDLTFQRNQLYVTSSNACIELENAGDSIRVRDSILTGTGYAIFGNQAAGATQLIVDTINGTCTHGIQITNSFNPILRNLELEFSTTVGTGACLVLTGCVYGQIGPGNISVVGGATGFSEAIFINGSDDVLIDGMVITATGGFGILINGTSDRTRIGIGNSYVGLTTDVSNGGVNTRTATYV